MVKYLRLEFDEILDKNDWMDDETKKNAFRKSRMMEAVIGYPEQLANDSLVNDHYKTVSCPKKNNRNKDNERHYSVLQLNLTDDNYELNIRRLRNWAQKRDFEKLRAINDPQEYVHKPIDNFYELAKFYAVHSWPSWKNFANSANVNAYYWSQANAIVIPAGILRDVFFDNDRPQYMNFGTIGYIIGHEITHAFGNWDQPSDSV